MTNTLKLLFGVGTGVLVGLGLAATSSETAVRAAAIVAPIGRLWLNALQMTVIPLVVSLLVVGVAGGTAATLSGRVARRSVAAFVVLLAATAAFSALVAPLAMSMLSHDPDLATSLRALAPAAAPAGPVSASDWLGALIPTNVIAAAANNAILPLVVFALFFAFALTRIASERRQRAVELFQTLGDAMIVMVHWILWAAPVGVFALIMPLCATSGFGLIGALGYFVLFQCVLYVAITLGMYGVAVIGGRERLARFAVAVFPAQAVAATTQSSLASLPVMVRSTEALGHPAAVRGLVLPLAVSLFRATSPASYLACAAFAAWAYGLEISVTQLVIGAIVAVVMSFGSVGLPGGVAFMATHAPVMHAMGVPTDLLGVLLAVDVIPDVFATVGNVTADVAVTSVVSAHAGNVPAQPA